jgi:hypothetical protein
MISTEDILQRELPLHRLMAQQAIRLKPLRPRPKVRNTLIPRRARPSGTTLGRNPLRERRALWRIERPLGLDQAMCGAMSTRDPFWVQLSHIPRARFPTPAMLTEHAVQ